MASTLIYKKCRKDESGRRKSVPLIKEPVEQWPHEPSIWGDVLIEHEDQSAANNWGHGIGLTLYEYPII